MKQGNSAASTRTQVEDPYPKSGQAQSLPRSGRKVRSALVMILSASALVSAGFWLGSLTASDRNETMTAMADVDEEAAIGSTAILPVAMDDTSQEAITRNFVGIVHPGESMAVMPPFDSKIVALANAEFGAAVQKGDPIVTLDSAKMRRDVKQARMIVNEAKSELLKLQSWSTNSMVTRARREVENAKRTADAARRRCQRTKELLDEGIIAATEYEYELDNQRFSESALDIAEDNYESILVQGNHERVNAAKHKFELAEEEYQALNAAIEQRVLRAPKDGILLPGMSESASSSGNTASLSLGHSVQMGEVVYIVGDTETIQIKTLVSEIDVDHLYPGQEAIIRSLSFGADAEIVGKVMTVSKYTSNYQHAAMPSSGLGPTVSRYAVTISVPAEDLGIDDQVRFGMTVDIEIVTDHPNEISVDKGTDRVGEVVVSY